MTELVDNVRIDALSQSFEKEYPSRHDLYHNLSTGNISQKIFLKTFTRLKEHKTKSTDGRKTNHLIGGMYMILLVLN